MPRPGFPAPLSSLPGVAWQGPIDIPMENPLTELPVYAGVWADDPAWVNGGVGTAPESLRVAGSIGTTTATQGTPAARGTLTTSALLGGRRVLDLDGTDDCYELTTGVSLAQPFEVWAIVVADSTAGNHHILGTNSASSVNRVGIASAQWAARFGAAGSAVLGGTPEVATAYATRFVANGASSAIYANGASQATGGSATDAMDQFIVGAGRTAPATYASFMNGKTALLLTLPTASITQAHRTAMGQWAARFYGVAGFAGAFG